VRRDTRLARRPCHRAMSTRPGNQVSSSGRFSQCERTFARVGGPRLIPPGSSRITERRQRVNFAELRPGRRRGCALLSPRVCYSVCRYSQLPPLVCRCTRDYRRPRTSQEIAQRFARRALDGAGSHPLRKHHPTAIAWGPGLRRRAHDPAIEGAPPTQTQVPMSDWTNSRETSCEACQSKSSAGGLNFGLSRCAPVQCSTSFLQSCCVPR